MTHLTITTSRDSATLLYDDKVIADLKRDEFTGEITLPLTVLADDVLRHYIHAAGNDLDKIHALTKIWEWADENIPEATVVHVDYESEYNDEGGYYWRSDIGFGPSTLDLTPELEDAICDLPYDLDVNLEPEIVPAGEYKKEDRPKVD